MSIEEFGEYEVQKREDGSLFELGRSSMAVTYKAFDTNLRRFAALKIINPEAFANPDVEVRFIREACAVARLRHPNIATVYCLGRSPEDIHYCAMEFCEGQNIEQLVKQKGPLEWRRALEIAAQAANALAAAARENLTHRDIKPSNLVLVREDEGEVLKVINFGLTKMKEDDGAVEASMGAQQFIEAPHFASPEQIENGIVDTRSDIYSFGATLWFMLAGSPPFTGSIWKVISQHLLAEPDFSRLTNVPENVVALIRRTLGKSAEGRPQTAKELLELIKKCLLRATGAEPAPDVEPAPDTEPAPHAERAADMELAREEEPVPDAQPTPDMERAADMEPLPEVEPVSNTEPSPDAQPVSVVGPTPDTAPAADMEPAPNAEPVPDAQPTSDTERAVDMEPAPNTKPSPDAQPASDVGPASDSAPAADMELAPNAEPVPNIDPMPNAQPVSDVRPTPDTAPAADMEPAPNAEPVPDAQPTPNTERAADVEPPPEVGPVPNIDPMPHAQPPSDPGPASDTVPAPDAKRATDAQPAPDVGPVPNTKAAPDVGSARNTEPAADAQRAADVEDVSDVKLTPDAVRAPGAKPLAGDPAPHPATHGKPAFKPGKGKIFHVNRRQIVIAALISAAVSVTLFFVFGRIRSPSYGRSPANADNSGSAGIPKRHSPPGSVEGGAPPIAKPGDGAKGPDLSADPLADGSMGASAGIPGKPTQVPISPQKGEDSAPADRFEQLIGQGKKLREHGDTNPALVRFREASAMNPQSPIPIAEIATTYEKMGLGAKAGEQWRQIYDMGEAAGIYFSLADAKLKVAMKEGLGKNASAVAPDAEVAGIASGMTLGLLPITTEDKPDDLSARRFTLHIPIKARPNSNIDAHELVIHVLFFDILNGQNVVQTSANVNSRWLTAPADWVDSDTEELAVEYQLPKPVTDTGEKRKYFGYVVRIYYERKLQSARADPERLGQLYPAPPNLPNELNEVTASQAGTQLKQVLFQNSLGMKFVRAGTADVLFCIWQTRVRDFEAYASAQKLKSNAWRRPGFKQGADHPVVDVTWQEAIAFCNWLTEKEHKDGSLPANQLYRLPTDLEWSKAVGLPDEPGKTPAERDMAIADVYPWGKDWPPPASAGNYSGEETGSDTAIKGYNDGFAWTSPVGSFKPNKFGLYDMGGNVWQWCMDSWNGKSPTKVLRGASWGNGALKLSLLSSCRVHAAPDSSTDNYGFRIVKATEGARSSSGLFPDAHLTKVATPIPTTPIPATPIPTAQIATTPIPTTPIPTTPKVATPAPERFASVTKEAAYVNSLGMEFVPAGTRGVLFCKWDTRVGDYREFVNAANRDMSGGMYVLEVKKNDEGGYSASWELDKAASWSTPGFQQSDAHPVVGVSLEDGRAFCEWLTDKERKAGLLPAGAAYRLPRDEEWSAAVGSRKFPWGDSWPPRGKVGNYADANFARSALGKQMPVAPAPEDGRARTSTVGMYKANRYGLFDMGGNVWQWCDTEYKASMNSAAAIKAIPALKDEKTIDGTPYRVVRGASWDDSVEINMRSAFRNGLPPTSRRDDGGFRCVLVTSGG
jgi:formylglycine-generating enzyme required for sulfatase activity/serine/threonine protein kinase